MGEKIYLQWKIWGKSEKLLKPEIPGFGVIFWIWGEFFCEKYPYSYNWKKINRDMISSVLDTDPHWCITIGLPTSGSAIFRRVGSTHRFFHETMEFGGDSDHAFSIDLKSQ